MSNGNVITTQSVFSGVLTTTIALSLVGVFVLLRTLSGDVKVNSSKLDGMQGWNSRINAVELQAAVLERTQELYHGKQIVSQE